MNENNEKEEIKIEVIKEDKKYYKCSECGKAVEHLKESRCDKCYWIKRDIEWLEYYDNCYGDF